MTTQTPDPFPNDWEQIKRTPSDKFVDHLTHHDMMIRSSSWDLPESVAGVIRIQNEDGTIREMKVETMSKFHRMVSIIEGKGLDYVAYDSHQMGHNYSVIGDEGT